MGMTKIKSGGISIDTRLKGKARVGGISLEFGPPAPGVAGPTFESLAWPQEPTSTSAIDPGQAYNMGIRFSLATGKNGLGIRWRVPDVITDLPPGDEHVASLWSESGQTRLAFKNFTPTPGQYQDITFDSSVALTAGAFYVAAVYTRHYVFRATTASVSSPSGNVTAQGGRLVGFNGGPNIYPDGAFGSWYYVAPIVSV